MSAIRPAVVLFVLFSLALGLAYPWAVTGLAHSLAPRSAQGSLIRNASGEVVGSYWIGQGFASPAYFWSRPSATAPMPYNAAASSGSNLGPNDDRLHAAVRERVVALREADPSQRAPVPVDLVTASASGLDPHISVAAARYQQARVARERAVTPEQVASLIDAHTERPLWGFLGEPRVHVLSLNRALDALKP